MIERSNAALKIEPLKRVGKAAGDETSADKRQEKREGDGATVFGAPSPALFHLEAQEETRYVAVCERLTEERLEMDNLCLSCMCVSEFVCDCDVCLLVCWKEIVRVRRFGSNRAEWSSSTKMDFSHFGTHTQQCKATNTDMNTFTCIPL